MIGQTISHYRIVGRLGEGGMGAVYLAEDTHLGRRVAIKFPTGTINEHHYRARFLREARAASALSHPNIATIYDYGETPDEQPFLVMELVEGKSLSDLLYEDNLTLTRAVEIVKDIAKALGEAHSHGIVHRDIKPSNVVINGRDQVKVLDFGLAKQLNEELVCDADPNARTLLATHTQSGAVVGTPLYLSPEQAKGIPVDTRSDLFALGAVLYECIAGKPAFSSAGAGIVEIAANVIHFDPPPPSAFNPHVPPELDRVTLKALAKKPEERHQSADELIADLDSVQAALQRLDAGQTLTQRIQPAPGTGRISALATLSDLFRRPRLSVGVVVIALLFAGITLWMAARLLRATPHQPSVEPQRWYDIGTNALREGSYYKASKALERAVAIDDKFALAHARLAEAWTELDYTDKAKDELLTVGRLVPDRSILPQLEVLYLDAVTATVTRDFTSAIKSYAEIARLKPDEPQVYVDLGRAYEKNDEIDQAIENYKIATTSDQQYATAILRLGILYGRKLDLSSAATTFDKAESLYQALDNFEGRTELLYQRGYLYNQLGKLSEAREQLQKALDITRTTNNQYQQLKTLLQLSVVAYSGGNTAQAKQYATEAIDAARVAGIENLTTQGLIDLGNAFLLRREDGEAEQYFKQALEFAQRNKGRRTEALALLSLGRLYIQQDQDMDNGLRYVEQALTFFQQGGYRKEISQALLLRGRAKLQKGDFNGALQEFEQQLQLAQSVNDPAQLANSHLLIGSLLADQELYSEALRHFDDCYAINKSLDNPLYIGYSLLNRANMYWRTGRYKEARAALSQVPAIAERLDSKYKQVLLARSHLVEAQMSLSEQRFGDAKTEGEQALTLSGTQIKHAAVEAKLTLGLAQSFSGAKRLGRVTCEEAVEMATRESDPRVLSKTLLALAEAMLEEGDRQNALSTARRAQELLARAGQQESEWRAWLIAGRAGNGVDKETAREFLARADTLLSGLQQTLGVEAFNGYLTRPDIRSYRKQLSEASTLSQ